MSGISGISALSSNIESNKEASALGKDEFLKLLVTQLKYQDPLSPMQNEDFIAQLAQFSTLESLKNVENSFRGMESYSLLGKLVVIEDAETGQEIESLVTGVKTKNSEHYIIIPVKSDYVDKDEAIQYFYQANLMYDVYKDRVFETQSLDSDKLVWKSNIGSAEDFASVLGFSNLADVPDSLKKLWDSSYYKEYSIDKVTHVFERN
jgi:flagellar basal-body rod modification protein FlgD